MSPLPDQTRRTAGGKLSVVAIYATFAGLWILLSDGIVGFFITDHDALVRASMIKGWAFVAVTTLLLYGLVSRLVRRLDDAHERQLRSEQQERQVLGLLSAIADSSDDAIFAKDIEGRYLIINAAACRFVGKTPDEVIGRDDRALFPPEQAEAIMAMDRKAVAEGHQSTAEEELDTPGGRIAFLATKGPLRDEAGRIFGTFGISRDITHRKEAERALLETQERLALFIEHAPAALAMFDHDMRYIAVSRRWRETFNKDGTNPVGLCHYDDFPNLPEHFLQAHQRGLAGEVVSAEEDHYQRPDGSIRWSRWEVRPWHRHDGSVGGIIIFTEDISARKTVEAELRIAATAFESQLAMIITDNDETILRVNQAFTDITGFPAEEAIGKTPHILLGSSRHDPQFFLDIAQTLKHGKVWQGEIWHKRKDGNDFPALTNISAVADDAGHVTHYVATFSDLSQHKRAEQLIHNLSFYDALTALPNRRRMLEQLQAMLPTNKNPAPHGAILFIDLDDFSNLNDTRGHSVGDEALVEAAKRIRSCVAGHDNVARPSSDEFVVILDNLPVGADEAAELAHDAAERIRIAIRAPMALSDGDYLGSASIGISLFRKGSISVDDLMKQADASMYQVKHLGRNRIHFFDAAMQAALEEHMSLEAALRQAIPDDLRLYFQPQVDDAGALIGAEALIRWQTRDGGVISPAKFIPLAEATGLILPIGRWVLNTACRQIQAWSANPATRHLRLAINVSARQFQQPHFVDEVIKSLDDTGIDPTRLKLELTESMLLDNTDEVIRKMELLKARGIRFSLDDFGTGFSSLSYLKRLPLNQLKIDQSFVRDVEADPNDAAIVRTIIALGQSLGLDVIAEGVETDGQRRFLAVHGCRQYQGYLFGRPVPVEEFDKAAGA